MQITILYNTSWLRACVFCAHDKYFFAVWERFVAYNLNLSRRICVNTFCSTDSDSAWPGAKSKRYVTGCPFCAVL